MMPGPVAVVSAAYRLLDGAGAKPFLLLGGALSFGSTITKNERTMEQARLTALDARFIVTCGKLFLKTIAPYATARAFGGPVSWTRTLDQQAASNRMVGSDKYHVQLGAGAFVATGLVDAFFEIIPLGARAATVGMAMSF